MKTITYDFATSEGDTIREKYETLIYFISLIHHDNFIIMITGSPKLISIFETIPKKSFIPLYVTIDEDTTIVGKFDAYTLIKSNKFKDNELMLLGQNENVIIEIKNFIC